MPGLIIPKLLPLKSILRCTFNPIIKERRTPIITLLKLQGATEIIQRLGQTTRCQITFLPNTSREELFRLVHRM